MGDVHWSEPLGCLAENRLPGSQGRDDTQAQPATVP